jgi:ubiquinone/menaquinone biosynthesis C-methylase UbiE
MKFAFRHLFGRQPLDARTAYDLWAEDYSTVMNPIKLLSDHFVRSVVIPSSRCVVDIGCGTGDHFYWAIQNGAGHVIGIDASEGMLRRTKRSQGHPIDLIRAHAECLPIASAAADVIICTLVAGHFSEFDQVIEEMSRILCPGAHLVMTDFHYEAARRGERRTFVTRGRVYTIEHTIHDEHRYRQALANGGFTIQRIENLMYQERPVVLGIHATKVSL